MFHRVSKLDDATYTYSFVDDNSQRFPLKFFGKGEPYKMWGLSPAISTSLGRIRYAAVLLGSDKLGRDMLSRIIYASRVSCLLAWAA